MEWSSVADITSLREYVPVRGRESIENIIEDKFIKGNFRSISIPMPPNVSSTISISISHDGQYFATTHGDHTVKVFMYHTFKLIREFRGHPRTPWTVKFHPKDSDKVASGCLGCQVIVWSISENVCLSKVRLEFSIISICFHPEGDLIAIASGTKLELWDWTKKQSSSRGGYNLAPSTAAPPVSHVRNIRAVTFHPNGDYLFAAAPDAPRQSNEAVTYCSLYAIKVAHWLQLNRSMESPSMMQEDEHSPLRLTNHTLILPQIHLYSDGGLDISKDGQHLVTCSRLFFPPSPPPPPISSHSARMDSKVGLSPLSTTERMEEDEYSNQSMPAPLETTASNSTIPGPYFSSLTENTSGLFENSTSTLLRRLQGFDNPTGSLAQAAGAGSNTFALSNSTLHPNIFPQPNGEFSSTFPSLAFSSTMPVNSNDTRLSLHSLVRSSFPSSSSLSRAHIAAGNHQLRHLYETKRMISQSTTRNRQPEQRNTNASLFMHDEQGNVLDHNSLPLPPGWKVDDHLCIFKLHFRSVRSVHGAEDIPEVFLPQIVNAKPLVGGLMRAITSVKWSPSNRHVLIGFGVRYENRVQDHSYPMAACEILSTQSPYMPSVRVVEDVEDEVNIAQFHPMPGYGVVYGTKRGKTKVFVLPK